MCRANQIGMYEGVGFVNRRFPGGGGAVGADRAREVQETVEKHGWFSGFASGDSPGRGVQGWQARLPRHVFALKVAHDAIGGHDHEGLNQFADPPVGVMPILELAPWPCPNLTPPWVPRGNGSRRRGARSRPT